MTVRARRTCGPLAALAACVALAGASTAGAAETGEQDDLPSLPPQVVSVTVIGYWADGGVAGDMRLIIYESGLEEPSYRTMIDWTARDFDKRRVENRVAEPLLDCRGQPVDFSEIVSFSQTGIRGPAVLRLRVRGAAEDGTSVLTYEAGRPGQVGLVSGC